MKGAFARAWALFLRRSQGARGVRWVQGAFAGARGRVALFLGRSQGRGGAGHCFWGVRKSKKRVYDFFATDVRFFCKFEFYVHIHYYF